MRRVKNREYIENLIYDTFSAQDPTMTNTNKYKTLFANMNDSDFAKTFKEFLANEKERFVLDAAEFQNGIKLEYGEAALKVLGVPLMEYIYMPHLTGDRSITVRSKQKCLTAYCNVKRTQQLLHKKNGLSVSNDKVSNLTGQVTGSDKNARDSDVEAAMLVALGADDILSELHGLRADDIIMKRQARQEIAKKGSVMLGELENSPLNKTTLNTINTYLLAMGIKSDLISDTYILPSTSGKHFR